MKNDIESVTIYVTPGCPYSRSALDWLDSKKVPYQKITVPGDKSKREMLDKFSNEFPDDPRGVPVIVVKTKNGKECFFNEETDPRLEELIT